MSNPLNPIARRTLLKSSAARPCRGVQPYHVFLCPRRQCMMADDMTFKEARFE